MNASSWRTTILGIITIASAVFPPLKMLLSTGSLSGVDVTTLVPAIAAGVGLMQARDQAAHTADMSSGAIATAPGSQSIAVQAIQAATQVAQSFAGPLGTGGVAQGPADPSKSPTVSVPVVK
jgi:hypothetical protein